MCAVKTEDDGFRYTDVLCAQYRYWYRSLFSILIPNRYQRYRSIPSTRCRYRSHPTAVHLRLIGKHIVDFLSVIIELFLLGVMAEVLGVIVD